jgi:hypothetical protein
MAVCSRCGQEYSIWFRDLFTAVCPKCRRQSTRPARPRAPSIFENHTLAGMAIYFVLYVVMVGMILVPIFGLLSLVMPWRAAAGLFIIAWLGFAIWLWLKMVRAGKINKEAKATDAELFLAKLIFFIGIGGSAFQVPFGNNNRWDLMLGMVLIVDWIFLTFQVVYILLALCVGARLPMRTYLVFAILLAFAVTLTLRL